MKAFVITLKDNEYSESAAERCIKSAEKHKLHVSKFYGIDKSNALKVMDKFGLKWTWANMNTTKAKCPITGLMMSPYRAKSIEPIIGCAMSHYSLWMKCIELDEPIVILEHDTVFIKDFPFDMEFKGICGLNDPRGATRMSHKWYKQSLMHKGEGVFPKPLVVEEDEQLPDGLAGNSAYIMRPWAAKEVINKVKEIGVWPNDATMCIQLFPYLEEYYPFVTKVIQGRSTTTK